MEGSGVREAVALVGRAGGWRLEAAITGQPGRDQVLLLLLRAHLELYLLLE